MICDISDKLARSDIVCLQETWLTKQDLGELNSLNPCFHGTGEAKVDCDNGCMCGDLCVNHLMYADDLVVFCPYSGGMQTLLKICTEYGYEFDIKYNSTKSNVLVVYGLLGFNASATARVISRR